MSAIQIFLRIALAVIVLGSVTACGESSSQNEKNHGHSHE